MSEVKTWIQWRYEDHCRADDKFVKESDHLATIQALEARVRELEAFLEQIVTVDPDGKDLWIQTVKIRAAQYLDTRKPQ